MKVYLDTCSLQRPLDGKDQVRIALEAEAVISIIAMCESGSLEIVSSEALLFECLRNTNMTRKEFAIEVLKKARFFVKVDAQVQKRAKELNDNGLMALDALHLAAAERGEADYFCTCDDRLLKKARSLCDNNIRIVSPVELIVEIEK